MKTSKMLNVLIFLFVLKQCHGSLILGNNSSWEIDLTQLPDENMVNKGWEEAYPDRWELLIRKVNEEQGRTYPKNFDWTSRGAVSPVKDQQTCSACWAFAVVANIESHLNIYKNTKEILSEQFLIDCDDEQGGCKTGSMVKSYANIVSKFGGVLRKTDYPAYANKKQKCRWLAGPPYPVLVTGFKRVEPVEEVMLKTLYDQGPLSAGLSSECIRNYVPGTIHNPPANVDYQKEQLDHAALIVGYGYERDYDGNWIPFWRLKNSWGTDWGDHGFFKIVRGRNACGIRQDVSFSTVI